MAWRNGGHMHSSKVRRLIRLLAICLWLPLAILVLSVIRFGGLPADAGLGGPLAVAAMVGSMVLFTWIAAMPLTAALALLHRRARIVAYVCGAVLAPITVFGALIGGLFGPIGIVAYALAFAVPAWIALGVTVLIQRNRSDIQPAEIASTNQ